MKDEVQYMSISVLAEQCKVAESTISRFCKSINLNSYSELKLMIAKSSTYNSATTSSYSSKTSLSSRAKRVLMEEIDTIKNTFSIVDENEIKNAVELLYTSDSVYCFGQGASGNVASDAWIRFSTISNKFSYISDSHLQCIATSLCTTKDSIIYFCYSGSTKEVLDILSISRKNGVKIILITNFSKSPAVKYADIVLLCNSRESPLDSGSICAKMSQLFLIDVLYNEYCIMSNNIVVKKELTAYALSKKI